MTHIWQLFSIAAICWTAFKHTHFLSISAQTSHEYERTTIFLWIRSYHDFITMFSVSFTVTLEVWPQGEQHLRVTWLLLNSPEPFPYVILSRMTSTWCCLLFQSYIFCSLSLNTVWSLLTINESSGFWLLHNKLSTGKKYGLEFLFWWKSCWKKIYCGINI